MEAYDSLRKIGEGSYGVVFRAIDRKTKQQVALKKIRLDQGGWVQRVWPVDGRRMLTCVNKVLMTNDKPRHSHACSDDEGVPSTALREISLLRDIRHPNIIW